MAAVTENRMGAACAHTRGPGGTKQGDCRAGEGNSTGSIAANIPLQQDVSHREMGGGENEVEVVRGHMGTLFTFHSIFL